MIAPLAKPVWSQPRLPLERSHDYRFPSPSDPWERVTVLKTAGAKVYASGERVSYRGFDNKTYELNRFHGLYVDILLPDSWLGPQALSEEQVHHFVDRTDLIYQYLLDMVGKPPGGEGPVPIAVLPKVCGDALGCANVGVKGVEMADPDEFRDRVWQEIAADVPSGVLIHELTHNFDVYWPYLAYISDGAHGWTSFISESYALFTHEGNLTNTPEELTRVVIGYSSPFFDDPTATWESCVRNDQCVDRNLYSPVIYGGFGLRIARQYGPQTVRGFTAFLQQYEQSHEPPATVEGKNDLYVEALAAGARQNLGCVADGLRWPVSDSLRQRMRQRYGTRNPACEDQDHDGFTPLRGDCNDHRATVHPGAPDTRNRLDDDCDGAVDETLYRGVGGTWFTDARLLSLPAEASGAVGGVLQDFYQVHLRSPDRLQVELCYEERVYGSVTIGEPGGPTDGLLAFGGSCSFGTFALEAGDWDLWVGLSTEAPANYRMTVQKAAPWPLPPWARTAPPQPRGRQLVLKATTAIPRLPSAPASVRFWVSGQGYVGTVPYSRDASLLWTPPDGVDPVADGLTYRAQVMGGGVPVYEVSAPRGFGE
jgi:hypothetical protein